MSIMNLCQGIHRKLLLLAIGLVIASGLALISSFAGEPTIPPALSGPISDPGSGGG